MYVPRLLATPIAERPATPTPMTKTLAGSIFPAALTTSLLNLGN